MDKLDVEEINIDVVAVRVALIQPREFYLALFLLLSQRRSSDGPETWGKGSP